MAANRALTGSLAGGGELACRALDGLDLAVIVLSQDCSTSLYANECAARLFGSALSPSLRDAIDQYVLSRLDRRRLPAALRVVHGGRAYYLRVVASDGAPPVEIVYLRAEVLRDVEVLRILEQRFRISRREYQIVCALRLGKTNRQISTEVGIAEGTVARHVHRLLQRLGVSNRTGLVHLVDELVKQAG